MELDGLTLLHLSKPGARPQDVAMLNQWLVGSFYLETCQRHIWILVSPPEIPLPLGADQRTGPIAYEKLLEVTTGLASLIPGEADVFGQFRRAWEVYCQQKGRDAAALNPWIQKLYADTKAIRHEFLQGIGGASYGTRVRRLLKRLDPESRYPVVVYGAGALSKAILPYLGDFQVGLTNRSVERLDEFLLQVQKLPPRLTFETAALQQGPHHCIFAVPAEAETPGVTAQTLSILHLGITEDGWDQLNMDPGFKGQRSSLTELFEVERDQDLLRRNQLESARSACQKSAIKRVSEARVRERYVTAPLQVH